MSTSDSALQERSEASASHKKPRAKLVHSDLALMLKLRKEGLTQTAIAQRFGCDQGYVSKWLAQCDDSTESAKSYLRGQALPMARNIVKKGRAADHVVALKGLGVLEEQQQSGLVVQIGGGSNVQVNVQLSPSLTVSAGEGALIP